MSVLVETVPSQTEPVPIAQEKENPDQVPGASFPGLAARSGGFSFWNPVISE